MDNQECSSSSINTDVTIANIINHVADACSSSQSSQMKLGQAFREWYCLYCHFSATSKYHVKEHCLTNHPGQAVKVSGHRLYE